MADEQEMVPIRGANFWIRAAAHLLVDLPILLCTTVPVTMVAMIRLMGVESLMTPGAAQIPWWWNVVFNLAIIVLLVVVWRIAQATPGKQAFRLKIVRLADGGVPSVWQWTLRAVGYLISSLPVIPLPVEMFGRREILWVPLCLGFLWILVDPRRRGWHDFMSGTVTVQSSAE